MRPAGSPRRGQRGFTLLELLVTLTITTIGMLGVLSLHLSLSRGNDGAARAAESITIAKDTMESLRSLRYADMLQELGTAGPTTGTPITVNLATINGRAGMVYRRRVILSLVAEDTDDAAQLVRVRVEVAWTEDGAVRSAADDFAAGRYDHSTAFELLRTNQEAL